MIQAYIIHIFVSLFKHTYCQWINCQYQITIMVQLEPFVYGRLTFSPLIYLDTTFGSNSNDNVGCISVATCRISTIVAYFIGINIMFSNCNAWHMTFFNLIFLHDSLLILMFFSHVHNIPSQGGKVDLDLWPHDPKSIGFLPSSSTCELWKWFDINCSLYCANKVWYTECQSWPWPWPCAPKSIGFLPLSSTTYMWSLKVIGQKL